MNQILFYILYSITKLFSLLPDKIIYTIANAISFLLFNVFKYRRKVVQENLKLAFPSKSDKERKAIEKKFYKHLCVIFIELIRPLSFSISEIRNRYKLKNQDILKKFNDKSLIILSGHYANWEWYSSFPGYNNYKSFAIYTTIQNKALDLLVKKIREKFGCNLIQRTDTIREMMKHKVKKTKGMYCFLSDQSPMLTANNHWLPFMGVYVPAFFGYEKIAKRYDMPVLFLKVKKIKHGYYETELELITETPKKLPDFEIVKRFTTLLEEQIKENPEYYFWTHRRWKHREKYPNKNNDLGI